MSKPIHIALDEKAFRTLVSGAVHSVWKDGQEIKIILSDIGFVRMANICLEADQKRIDRTYQDDRCGKFYQGPTIYIAR